MAGRSPTDLQMRQCRAYAHLVCAGFLRNSSDSHTTAQSLFLVRRWRKEGVRKEGRWQEKDARLLSTQSSKQVTSDLPSQESGVCLDRHLSGGKKAEVT